MTTKKSSGTDDTQLPEEPGIKRLYGDTASETPPATVDAKILIAAQQAISKEKNRFPFGARWGYPLSSAAVIALSLGVALLLSQQGVFDRQAPQYPLSDSATAPGIARDTAATPTTPAAQAPGRLNEKSPAKTESAKLDTLRPAAAENPPASTADRMEAKKSGRELSTSSGALHTQEKMAEERAASPIPEVARSRENLAMKNEIVRVQADVISVQVTGEPGAYQFTVGILSPDTGCQQYADWWEVVGLDGKLLYRRVLLHSHVSEQPFTRSGGPVPIQSDTVVWVRAHVNKTGYGGAANKGSVKSGFSKAALRGNFASELENQAPLPGECNF
ncbi:MAG: hypothetical protein NUV51_12760 [Sulfuricaulis sp.]|nr:hypothetical protein [Sulfuricaulis sp.]